MNIIYLKYAVEVARIGSLSKAAEALYVAQPNLSRAIKELEKELGITIFDRNSKGMSLTPDGEKLIQYGKKILQQIDEVQNMFKEEQSKKEVFSISVPRASYISHAFASFSKYLMAEDQCDIFYKETNALRAINNILHADYKLGIIRYAAQYDNYFKELLDSKNFIYELVAEFRFVLLMSKDCPLAKKEEITYDDLKDYIEIAHADPFVPSLPLAEVKKEELPDNVQRRIFVFERASQFDTLSTNPNAFMWVSPIPNETLERYGLVQFECKENQKYYKDVLIYPSTYRLLKLDKLFITELCKSKRDFIK